MLLRKIVFKPVGREGLDTYADLYFFSKHQGRVLIWTWRDGRTDPNRPREIAVNKPVTKVVVYESDVHLKHVLEFHGLEPPRKWRYSGRAGKRKTHLLLPPLIPIVIVEKVEEL